jgi:hypothetical protein
VTDAEAMYKVLDESLPQADWRALVAPADMARFAASRGGAFPEPTYSDGAGAAVDGAAVALLGDSLHCFPPDLGQARARAAGRLVAGRCGLLQGAVAGGVAGGTEWRACTCCSGRRALLSLTFLKQPQKLPATPRA